MWGEDFAFQTGGEWNEVQNELKFVKVFRSNPGKFLDLAKTHATPNAKSIWDFDYYKNPFTWHDLLYYSYVISCTGNDFMGHDLLYHSYLIRLNGLVCFDLLFIMDICSVYV